MPELFSTQKLRKMTQIDLNEYRTRIGEKRSRVFTGRDRGADVRDKSRIDSLFPKNDFVQIIIPDDIFSITPSFLEEFFNNIVLNYGKQETLNKVKFKGKYKIQGAFDEAIDRILQQKTGLQK